MNIIEFIKNLFRNKNISSNNIILAKNLIKIPNRNDYKDNKVMLDSINHYKAEYRQILNSNQFFSSINFNNDNLFTKMKMYIELCLNTFNTDYLDNIDYLKDLTLEEKYDYLLRIYKYKIYFYNIIDLEKETRCKLVALQELANNKLLSRNKRNSILNEIDILTNALIIYENVKLSIILRINTYINNSEFIINTSSFNKINEYIENKNKLVEKIYYYVFNKEINITNVHELAKAEEQIEVYAYKHEELAKLKVYLANFEVDTYNKDELLKDIEKIEYKLLAFYLYGKDIITEKDLNTLYEIKFKILTLTPSILDFNEVFVNNETFYKELECYMKIVEKKINSLVNGIDSFYSEEINKKYINIIKSILKNKKGYFDYYEILTNKLLLNVLLSMNNKNKMIYLLNNYEVNVSEYPFVNFYEEYFTWNDKIPLISLYRLMSMQNFPLEKEIYKFFKNDIYVLQNEYYYLPQGIKRIKDYQNTKNEKILTKIRRDMEGKTLVCPSSLRSIDGPLFINVNLKNIKFNAGLETVGSKVFSTQTFNKLVLPFSLEQLVHDSVNKDAIKDVYITDYIPSYSDYQKIYDILFPFIDYNLIGKKQENGKTYYLFHVELDLVTLNILFDNKSYTINKNELNYQLWSENPCGIPKSLKERINNIIEINRNENENEYTRLLDPMKEIFASKGINDAILANYDKGHYYVFIKQKCLCELNQNLIIKIASIYKEQIFYSDSINVPDNIETLRYTCDIWHKEESWLEPFLKNKEYIVFEFDINDKFIILGTTIMLANILQNQKILNTDTLIDLHVALDYYYTTRSKNFSITNSSFNKIKNYIPLTFIINRENLYREVLGYLNTHKNDSMTLKRKLINHNGDFGNFLEHL